MQVLERPTAQSTEQRLDAQDVHTEIQSRLATFTAELQAELGIVQTELTEVAVHGPHRLLVLDETVQPTGNFKYNGAAFAVHQRQAARTYTTGTAGNFGAALAEAAYRAGKDAVLYAPDTLPEAKRTNMECSGGKVRTLPTDVMGAIATANALAETNSDWAFVHPFDDLDAIAGQRLVGQRLALGLQDIQGPKRVLIQRGGGSLGTGVASALYDAQLPDTQLTLVRPERVDGRLDGRYDGLAVEEPGHHAHTLLENPAFVAGTMEISEADTGRAAARMYRALGKRYEPSGLAGAAAFEKLAKENAEPTTYVAVLSGANVAPETYADFRDAPRREQVRVLQELANLGMQEMAEPALLPGNPAQVLGKFGLLSGFGFPDMQQ